MSSEPAAAMKPRQQRMQMSSEPASAMKTWQQRTQMSSEPAAAMKMRQQRTQMSSEPAAAMKTWQQWREQANQSDATHSSPLAISETANVRELVLQLTHRFDKVTRRFDAFRGEVFTRLHFLEEKVQHIEDRFTYGDPRRP